MNRTQKNIIGWALVGLGGLMVFGTIANTWRLEKAFDQLLTNPLLCIGLGLGVAGAVVLVGLKREDGGGEALGTVERKKRYRFSWSSPTLWIGIIVLLFASGIIMIMIAREDAQVARKFPSGLRTIKNRPDVGSLSFQEWLHESRPPDAMDMPIDKEAPVGFFTIGSSKEEVLAAQGEPTYKRTYVWWYDDSRVLFDKNERVWRYKNSSGNLKVWNSKKEK